MYIRYNYRLKPNQDQEKLFRQVAGNQRYIWNYFLNQEITQYQETKTFNFYNKNSSSLPSLKKELEWLQVGPSQSLQQTLKDLNNALITSFKGMQNNKRGFPKFKKKKNFSTSFRIVQTPDHWNFNKKHIFIPKIGEVKWNYHRKIPSDFSTATILLDGDKWYISIVIDIETKQPIDIKTHNQIVGIDMNSKLLVVTSDNQIFTNPKYLKRQQKLLKRRQRQLAKSTKVSNRYKIKQLKLYNKHKLIRNQRSDNNHKISNQITNDYDLICLEDLNISAMQKYNGQMTSDAGWAQLISMIVYKSKIKGKNTIKINRFAPSTKTCNNCGNIQEMPLDQREYNCECGCKIGRDLNAAMNIRDWGLADFIKKNTAGTAEIHGRGDTAIESSEYSGDRYVSLNRQKFFSSNRKEATFPSGA